MMQLPKAANETGRNGSSDRALEELQQTLGVSALLGLFSGFGEALIDLVTPPFSPTDFLYVTVVANVLLFLLIGLFFWILDRGLKPQVAYFLLLFILLWALLHNWEAEFAPQQKWGFVSMLSLATCGVIAALAALWASTHTIPRMAGHTLRWAIGIALVPFCVIPMYRLEANHRAAQFTPMVQANLPNIVLIIVDSLRADHLSCYGYPRATSPNLDRLARRGVLFENAIAPSSWTLPSHASILTGLYPEQHHAETLHDRLRVDIPTLAEELKQAGYRTGAFSGSPFFTPRQGLDRGFMEFKDFWFSPLRVFTQAHDIGSILSLIGKAEWVSENTGHPSAIDVNNSVIDWLDESQGQGPFFVTLNYFEVHEPNSLPPSWRRGHWTGQNPAADSVPDESRGSASQLTERIEGRIDGYDGAIAFDDDRVQKLITDLDRRHLMDNTLVIVTADHGEGLGEHGLFDHGTALYFPLIHVPLILYWPGHIPAGLQVSRPVSTRDIAATIMQLLNNAGTDLQGQSFVSLWKTEKQPDQWPMPLSELRKLPSGQDQIKSIISSEFQLILDVRDGRSLYDWGKDPQETENLIVVPDYEAVAKGLEADLKRIN